MGPILTGSKERSISNTELSMAIAWLDCYDFLDYKHGQRAIIAYGNPEILEKIDVEECGPIFYWNGHEVVENPEIPDNVLLIVVSERNGDPGQIIVWESELDDEEAHKRSIKLREFAVKNHDKRRPTTISDMIIYTMIAQCTLEDLDN